MTDSLQIARGVVDVWPEPHVGSNDDRLTQALLGCPAEVLEHGGSGGDDGRDD